MQIINQSVSRTPSGTAVDFVGEAGEKISVFLTGAHSAPSDALAIDKAKATMVQVATFGIVDDTEAQTNDEPPVEQHEASTSRTYSPID